MAPQSTEKSLNLLCALRCSAAPNPLHSSEFNAGRLSLARRVSQDVEREVDFIPEFEQAAGDGNWADVEIGQPQLESALRAQLISLHQRHHINSEFARHSVQRQFAGDLRLVSAFGHLTRRDNRALENDLRITGRFESLLGPHSFDLTPILLAQIVNHDERIGPRLHPHRGGVRRGAVEFRLPFKVGDGEPRIVSEGREQPLGESLRNDSAPARINAITHGPYLSPERAVPRVARSRSSTRKRDARRWSKRESRADTSSAVLTGRAPAR